jgi:hypothetical protein
MTPALERAFAAALLDPDQPCPAGLRSWNGSDAARRLAVHRNNVVVAWVTALGDGFPVLRQLVGADFFDAMAREFAWAQPPATPVLAEWGAALPAFVEGFAPAASLPYLPDVARLEWAALCAGRAADRPVLQVAHLTARLAAPQRLPGARVEWHPSLALVRSRFAVASLWAAHPDGRADDAALADVDPMEPENALLLRSPDDQIVVHTLADGPARLVARLQDGQPLGRAAEGVPTDELVATLARLIALGAVVGWHDASPSPDAPAAAPGDLR